MTLLERKCLEMELRLVLDMHRYGDGVRLMPWQMDELMQTLMPFMERKILERRERP